MAEIVLPMGREAVLYYGPPNAIANTGTVRGVKDLTITFDKETADATRRYTAGWEDNRENIKRLKLAFDIPGVIVGDETTELVILQNTFFTGLYNGVGGTGIALYAKSKAAAGGAGPEGDFIISKMDRSEAHGDVQSYSFECTLTLIHDRTPAWSSA